MLRARKVELRFTISGICKSFLGVSDTPGRTWRRVLATCSKCFIACKMCGHIHMNQSCESVSVCVCQLWDVAFCLQHFYILYTFGPAVSVCKLQEMHVCPCRAPCSSTSSPKLCQDIRLLQIALRVVCVRKSVLVCAPGILASRSWGTRGDRRLSNSLPPPRARGETKSPTVPETDIQSRLSTDRYSPETDWYSLVLKQTDMV